MHCFSFTNPSISFYIQMSEGQQLPQHEDLLSGLCYYCRSEANNTCGICEAWYCDKECLLKDHERHKRVCKGFSSTDFPYDMFDRTFKINDDCLLEHGVDKLLLLPGPLHGDLPASVYPINHPLVVKAFEKLNFKPKSRWKYIIHYFHAPRVLMREFTQKQRDELFAKISDK